MELDTKLELSVLEALFVVTEAAQAATSELSGQASETGLETWLVFKKMNLQKWKLNKIFI